MRKPDALPWAEQWLDRPFDGEIPALVEAVAGLNAQTAYGPLVGIWSRIGRWNTDTVNELFRSYEIVKINVMRGTVHLLTARQYWAWRPALTDLLRRNVAVYCRGLWSRVDHGELLRWGTDFVSDGRPLTRAELGQAASQVFDDSPANLGFALRMILPLVEVPGPSVWQPERTRYVYAPPVVPGAPMERTAGLTDLAESFAHAFGTGSIDDFCYWSGLTKAEALPYGDALVAAAGAPSTSSPPAAIVLPEFDNLFFCRRRSESALYAAKKDPRLPPARMPGALVADGTVVGHWSASKKTGLRLDPWVDLDQPAIDTWERFRSWYGDR